MVFSLEAKTSRRASGGFIAEQHPSEILRWVVQPMLNIPRGLSGGEGVGAAQVTTG